jgi:hypothetical protein
MEVWPSTAPSAMASNAVYNAVTMTSSTTVRSKVIVTMAD